VHVPFKGTPEVVNELIAGRLDFAFVPITTALPHIRAGKLLPLAVASSVRTPLLPDLRTTEEAV
jgi:tripartite-type tricarboxylate transporter receptor subunit TctC